MDNEGPIVLDLGAISDEPVAATWHTVEIERSDYGLSRKQSLPKIFVMSRIVDEADPDCGRTIIWNLMLAGDGLLFTKRCFKALGYPEVLEYPTADALAESLIGLEGRSARQAPYLPGGETGQCQQLACLFGGVVLAVPIRGGGLRPLPDL